MKVFIGSAAVLLGWGHSLVSRKAFLEQRGKNFKTVPQDKLDDNIEITTCYIKEPGKEGKVIAQSEVTRWHEDAPNMEKARNYSLRKLLANYPGKEYREFRTACWKAWGKYTKKKPLTPTDTLTSIKGGAYAD